MHMACTQLCHWHAAGLPPMTMAVNLSSRQFQHHDLVGQLDGIIASTRCEPQWLELEITESLLLEHGERAMKILHALRERGFALSIDDFGTGYSSLSYLRHLPIDKLKIDRSFIKGLPNDEKDGEIAATIIGMAHNLHLKVLAEGVETGAQLAFLKARGCDSYQGYLCSKPVEGEAFERLLRGQGLAGR